MILEELKEFFIKQYDSSSIVNNKIANSLHYGNFSETKNFRKVLISSLLNTEIIHFAIKNKFHLIISNDMLSSHPIYNINGNLLKKLILLTRSNLCIFNINNLILEKKILETIGEGLSLKFERPLFQNEILKNNSKGYIFTPQLYPSLKDRKFLLKDLISRTKTNFELEIIRYVGYLNNEIHNLLIIFNIDSHILNRLWFEKFIQSKCNCIILNNITHEIAKIASKHEINLLELSYQKMISLWLQNFCKVLNLEYPYDEFTYYRNEDISKYWI